MEEFERNRTQNIINFKEYVSVIDVSHDGLEMAVGTASPNDECFTPIYIMNMETNTLKKRMLFHTRGVQSLRYNENSTYLLSVGNLKDNKLVVWDNKDKEMIAHTTQIGAIHEAKWKPFMNENSSVKNKNKVYEIAVCGRNKIVLYEFSPESKKLSIKVEKYLAHVIFFS